MTVWHWTLLAEALGFASGVLVLWPAVAANRTLRRVHILSSAFGRAKTVFGRQVGKAAEPALEKAALPKWSARDQRLLQAGAAFLALSFLIKILIVWNTSP